MIKRLNLTQIKQIWEILVECGGATPNDAPGFFYHLTEPRVEFRFRGVLGFGGKFYYPEMLVSCYREDLTPEREHVIDVINQKLNQLQSDWETPPDMSGVELITRKVDRIRTVHGHTPEHDAERHEVWELLNAAGVYLLGDRQVSWPWEKSAMRRQAPYFEEPTLEDMVNAGALIASAIDLKRAKEKQNGE